MTTHDKKQRDRLISAITLYLMAHPNAADSLEGIMQWWLPQQQNPVDINDLQQVLDYLVETRAVSGTLLLDGRMLYNQQREGCNTAEKISWNYVVQALNGPSLSGQGELKVDAATRSK